MKIRWLGNASFLVEGGGKAVYFDPYGIPDGMPQADIVLISHGHYDHCDPESIEKISKESTVVAGPASAESNLPQDAKTVAAGNTLVLDDIQIQAVHAYNTNKPNHPKGTGVGYIMELESTRIYHAGDTDLIPEMRGLLKVDVAFLPVGGTYTMDADEAVDAVEAIKPKIAIPMHYGTVAGSIEDAQEFKEKTEAETDTEVVILDDEPYTLNLTPSRPLM